VASVVLAEKAAFRVGDLLIDPRARRIRRGEAEEMLEPRVMQVLVALAAEPGQVLSRDALIALCWEGRIVGDNAINRVLSKIRRISETVGAGIFEIETIAKVGYRLNLLPVATVRPDAPPSSKDAVPTRHLSRRVVIGGALVVGIGGAVAIGGAMLGPRLPSAQARELFRRAEIAQRQGLPEQVRQAAAFYRQATKIDPNYAAAWGALALSYRHMLEGYGAGDLSNLPGQLRSAAGRALALDPDNADAQLALATALPFYRHWRTIEPALERLGERWPNHWLIQAQRGLLRQDVGRMREAIDFTERVQRIDAFLPVTHASQARALSCAGRVEEAERVIEAALNRWPGHPMLWLTRFNVLLFNRRFEKAFAFAQDPDLRPTAIPAALLDRRVALARALVDDNRAVIARAAEEARAGALADISAVPNLAPLAALLGAPDLAFDMLEAFYFGGGALGRAVAPPGPYDRRITVPLFSPPIRPLADRPRYRAIAQRTGLVDYWHATGHGRDGGPPL